MERAVLTRRGLVLSRGFYHHPTMTHVAFSWAFDTHDATTEHRAYAAQGEDSVPQQDHTLEGLATSLDDAREKLNDIVTCWKDAVGPEQDSHMGRSNAAHAQDDDEDEE